MEVMLFRNEKVASFVCRDGPCCLPNNAQRLTFQIVEKPSFSKSDGCVLGDMLSSL